MTLLKDSGDKATEIIFSFSCFTNHSYENKSKLLLAFFLLVIFAVLYHKYHIVNATSKPGSNKVCAYMFKIKIIVFVVVVYYFVAFYAPELFAWCLVSRLLLLIVLP